MVSERRSSFHDDHGNWPAYYFDPEILEQSEGDLDIDNLAVVLSACAAIKRLMDTVEQAACESAELSSQLRAAFTYREGDNDEPGAASEIPAVIDFMRGIGDAVDESEELARRLHATVLKSVIGEFVSKEI